MGNLFDILGPVMVGPSSSHTAGAVRIGNVARKLVGADIKIAKIYFHGSFQLTGKGHGTDKALLAGLIMTRLFKPLKLPSVTAYLIAGVLVGPYCLGALGLEGIGFKSMDAVTALSVVSEVALGFIAFSIGNEFRLSQLKEIGKSATLVTVMKMIEKIINLFFKQNTLLFARCFVLNIRVKRCFNKSRFYRTIFS